MISMNLMKNKLKSSIIMGHFFKKNANLYVPKAKTIDHSPFKQEGGAQ